MSSQKEKSGKLPRFGKEDKEKLKRQGQLAVRMWKNSIRNI